MASKTVSMRSNGKRAIAVRHDPYPKYGRDWVVSFNAAGMPSLLMTFRTQTGAEIAADAFMRGTMVSKSIHAGEEHDRMAMAYRIADGR